MSESVVTLGETMGLFHATSPGARPDGYRLGIGGAESNVAIGLARLGVGATWIGRVGSDGVGDLVQRELRAEGVIAQLVVDIDAPTGLMVKTQPVAGRSRVDYYRTGSAGSRLNPDDIVAETIQTASIVHLTGITPGLSVTAAAAVLRALDLADEAGVPVSFDINHRSAIWRNRDAAETYREIVRRSTIVFAGLDEAALIVSGSTPTELSAELAKLGPSQVLIKLGADGCLARVDGEVFSVDAVPITPFDTVGAGDAFAAGYLAELVTGKDAHARLLTAVRAGAFACLGPGDWESLPRRADLHLLDGDEPVVR